MARDPQTIANDWAARLAASGQKISDGIMAVTVAPGQAAARQKQVWVSQVTAAADKWATNVAAVGLSDWQQAAINKGVQRIGPGAQASVPKFATFMSQLLPHIDSVKNSLPARGNLDQNIDRMVRFSRGMAQFKKRS